MAPSCARKASAARSAGRGSSGRHTPITRSRPDGFVQSANSRSASIRNVSEASARDANAATASAFSLPPRRKLALRTRKPSGSDNPGRGTSAASCGMAASIGASLIARAASTTSSGSASLRKRATSGSSVRRSASSTPMRTADDGSSAAAIQASLAPLPTSAMTPACRK